MIKRGVRTIGIDDGPFEKTYRGNVFVAGAIFQGSGIFDGLLTTHVRKDGWNATDRLSSMIEKSKFLPQLHYLMLNGIALGGFNIVDIRKLSERTGLKAIAVMRHMPDLAAIRLALVNLSKADKRWRILETAGKIFELNGIFCQLAGISENEARDLLSLTCTRSKIPEPIRVAHLIAGAVVTGQSGRRA